jgi:hypothetical protein
MFQDELGFPSNLIPHILFFHFHPFIITIALFSQDKSLKDILYLSLTHFTSSPLANPLSSSFEIPPKANFSPFPLYSALIASSFLPHKQPNNPFKSQIGSCDTS